MHVLLLGIEHLMTGVQLISKGVISFEAESPSIIRATSQSPIDAHWPVTGSFMGSTEGDVSSGDQQILDKFNHKYSAGEAEWYARVVGPAMVDIENRSKLDMQTYTRRFDYQGTNGERTRYAPGEPSPFPPAVVKAMRRKFGAEADKWLAELRWDRDHWFFVKDQMYHGVEPDGYIHT